MAKKENSKQFYAVHTTQKTIATTAPADCHAHREHPHNAVTSNKLISGIKKLRFKPTGRKGESSFYVARHTGNIG